jgi:hypothetical protein
LKDLRRASRTTPRQLARGRVRRSDAGYDVSQRPTDDEGLPRRRTGTAVRSRPIVLGIVLGDHDAGVQ